LSSKTSKTDAEAKFARTQKRATDAARAMSDAQAEAKRVDENTLRLRALRIAKEARDAAEAAAAPPVVKGKAKLAAAAKAAPKAAAVAAKTPPAPAKAAKAPSKKAAKAMPAKKLNAANDG
jgi:hypothetical protein